VVPASWQKITSPLVTAVAPDVTAAVRAIGDPVPIEVTAVPFEIAESEVDVAVDAATTFTVSAVDALPPFDVPVIVTVPEPTVAELSAVNVTIALPVVGFGENEAVTPLGKPVAVKFTLPLNPFSGFTMTLDFAGVPGDRFRTPGAEETVNDC